MQNPENLTELSLLIDVNGKEEDEICKIFDQTNLFVAKIAETMADVNSITITVHYNDSEIKLDGCDPQKVPKLSLDMFVQSEKTIQLTTQIGLQLTHMKARLLKAPRQIRNVLFFVYSGGV